MARVQNCTRLPQSNSESRPSLIVVVYGSEIEKIDPIFFYIGFKFQNLSEYQQKLIVYNTMLTSQNSKLLTRTHHQRFQRKHYSVPTVIKNNALRTNNLTEPKTFLKNRNS